MKDLWVLAIPWWDLVLRCVVIYLLMVFGLRLFGKREVGQFTLFDIVLVLLIANAVQPAMTGPDSTLAGGLIIIATLLLLNFGVGQFRERNRFFKTLIQSHPTVIAQGGHWLLPAIQREGLDDDELEAALREHGIESVRDCKLAVLETDGTISVVPQDSQIVRTKRNIRYRHHML